MEKDERDRELSKSEAEAPPRSGEQYRPGAGYRFNAAALSQYVEETEKEPISSLESYERKRR